ncbi:magnesium transport protein CorA [Spirochaetia bacterium]|nr:magnesium transport protein CorA [Spirochaetia bacterium]
MDLSLIGYDPAGSWNKRAETVEELLGYRNTAGVTWINVDGLSDSAAINHLAEAYKIHPLTVEDIINTEQRPKIEEFDEYLFITLKAIHRKGDGEFEFDHISLVILENTVITFQELSGDSFDGIRRRIMNNGGKIRKLGTDYLAYTIIDSVVDEYFLILDSIGDGIDDFEDRAMNEKDTSLATDIQKVKRELLRIRRVLWPLRESLSMLLRLENPLISGELEPFLKDLHENTVQAAETVEAYRELMAGVMEVNLSAASNSLNKIMKVLTIISTIFIPLTFIVGVYGMNFTHMPELSYPYAYPITWGVMALIAIGMVILFKRRHWL